MVLCLKSSEECGTPSCSAVACVDCACDVEKVRVIHGYLQEHFPERTLRDFHSSSTAITAGVAAPCADHHVASISGELPYCAVLTGEFLEQPVAELRERLRRWNLASTLRAHRVVIVSRNGVSPL